MISAQRSIGKPKTPVLMAGSPMLFRPFFVCDFQAIERRVLEFFFIPFSLARADGMDDVSRIEVAAAGDHRAADRAAADFIAFLLHDWTALGANGAGHSAPKMSKEFAALTMVSVSSSVMSPSVSSRVLLFI